MKSALKEQAYQGNTQKQARPIVRRRLFVELFVARTVKLSN